MVALSAQQEQFQESVRQVAVHDIQPRAAGIDASGDYPHEGVEALVGTGAMGCTISAEYGGRAAPLLDAILAVEEVAKVCGTTARVVVETNMGSVGALMAYGTSQQKQRYLPPVTRGEKPAICITEPEAGSAATDMQTSARRDGDDFVLNGTKRFITGAGVSTLYLVFTRFEDGPAAGNIGGILVESNSPGLRVGKRWPMMGLRGLPECDVHFEDCRVPRGNLLVEQDGFKKLMSAYNGQRLGAATVALGIAAGAFELARQHLLQREQFGRALADFQGLQWMAADMHIQLTAARLLIHEAADRAGYGFPSVLDAAVAKVYASEMAITVTNNALQMFGGYGYSQELPLERMVRDARMFTIGGGTAQLQRNVIAEKVLDRKIGQRRPSAPARV